MILFISGPQLYLGALMMRQQFFWAAYAVLLVYSNPEGNTLIATEFASFRDILQQNNPMGR